jgi:thiamine-monophosphate kinase
MASGVAAAAAAVSAAMDISDGLAIDLNRLADASSVGFEVDEIPIADGATRQEALSGGEDYELLIATSDVEAFRSQCRHAELPEPIVIGRVVAAGTRTASGQPLPPVGWLHEF